MEETKSKKDNRSDFYKIVLPKIIWKNPLTNKDREIFVKWKNDFNPPMHLFQHYTNKNILFEIVKYVGNSELCLNENIRWLFSSKIDYLIKIFYFYRVLENRSEGIRGPIEGLTFYKGLMNFTHRSPPPFSPKEKREWQENVWANRESPEYAKRCCGYNFGLDIDGKDIEDAYSDARKVFKLLMKFNIKFSIWSSGKKGFHIIIPYEEFKDLIEPFDLDFCVTFCKGLMLDLVKHLKLRKVDTLIYSPTRYLKVPYSLDARNGRVILPLDNEEFLSFLKNKDKYFSQDYCHKLVGLGNLGAFRGRKSNTEGFKKLIDYLNEEIKE